METQVPCLLMVLGRSSMAWLYNDIYLKLSTGLTFGAEVLRPSTGHPERYLEIMIDSMRTWHCIFGVEILQWFWRRGLRLNRTGANAPLHLGLKLQESR